MELEQIQETVLADCANDDVALGHIIWRIRGGGYRLDDPELVTPLVQVIGVIKTLLAAGLIEAGVFRQPISGTYDFVPLGEDVERVVDYIERGWKELGRAPQIGEVCWFRATSKGRQVSKELGLID